MRFGERARTAEDTSTGWCKGTSEVEPSRKKKEKGRDLTDDGEDKAVDGWWRTGRRGTMLRWRVEDEGEEGTTN